MEYTLRVSWEGSILDQQSFNSLDDAIDAMNDIVTVANLPGKCYQVIDEFDNVAAEEFVS